LGSRAHPRCRRRSRSRWRLGGARTLGGAPSYGTPQPLRDRSRNRYPWGNHRWSCRLAGEFRKITGPSACVLDNLARLTILGGMHEPATDPRSRVAAWLGRDVSTWPDSAPLRTTYERPPAGAPEHADRVSDL